MRYFVAFGNLLVGGVFLFNGMIGDRYRYVTMTNEREEEESEQRQTMKPNKDNEERKRSTRNRIRKEKETERQVINMFYLDMVFVQYAFWLHFQNCGHLNSPSPSLLM